MKARILNGAKIYVDNYRVANGQKVYTGTEVIEGHNQVTELPDEVANRALKAGQIVPIKEAVSAKVKRNKE